MPKADFLPALESLADSRTLERGRGYFREGRVSDVRRTANRIDAQVIGSGTSLYNAHIALDMRGEKGVAYDCDCPVGETGDFCKHLIALMLVWQADPASDGLAAPVGNSALHGKKTAVAE